MTCSCQTFVICMIWCRTVTFAMYSNCRTKSAWVGGSNKISISKKGCKKSPEPQKGWVKKVLTTQISSFLCVIYRAFNFVGVIGHFNTSFHSGDLFLFVRICKIYLYRYFYVIDEKIIEKIKNKLRP